ncbi:MAG: hypothetical protein WCS33_00415 [Candidatus Caldatribacteriota bacterium]
MRQNETLNFGKFRDDLLPLAKDLTAEFRYTADDVLRIIQSDDYARIREVSNYFYTVSGIYKRIVWLFSSMFNFDNLIIPHMYGKSVPENKLIKDFQQAMSFIDSLNLKQLLKDVTFFVFKEGAYYGYLRDDHKEPTIQQLPINYCRSKYKTGGRNVVEFNLTYFDREYLTTEDRQQALKMFPKELRAFYKKYKLGTLNVGKMEREWVLLDVDRAICLKFPDAKPFFIGAIIDLIELREYKRIEMERDKLALFLLLIQKIPMTKEGEMVFDVTEAKELHKNALKMLEKNENVDVLTTFADMELLNLQESRQVMRDNLQKAERGVFNETGVSRMLFATEGNISLEKAIRSNEAIVRYLTELYSVWLTHITNLIVKPGSKYSFEVWLPPITIFNEKEMADKYIKQATLGYSKLLPGIVGGLKQSSLLNLLTFENQMLSLNDVMIPLKSTHTQSDDSDEDGGRPPKDPEEKTEETIDKEEGQE